MKKLVMLMVVGIMATACSSKVERKYEKKQMDLQKQEAKAMIDKLDGDDEIEIKRGSFGKDKIIIDEN